MEQTAWPDTPDKTRIDRYKALSKYVPPYLDPPEKVEVGHRQRPFIAPNLPLKDSKQPFVKKI